MVAELTEDREEFLVTFTVDEGERYKFGTSEFIVGLRGLEPDMTEHNLRQIVQRSKAAGARVLLVGMKVPPNYGGDYATRFEEIYPRLADELGVALMPFLLQDVAGDPELNLGDGIHPNAAGQQRIAANLVPYLREILSELQESVEVD